MIDIKKIFNSIFKKKYQSENIITSESPNIFFEKLLILNKTPSNDSVKEREFMVVSFKDKFLWTMFRCPCGCGNVITLPLKKTHSPHWIITGNKVDNLTLYPSVWQNSGCCSHFWIRDGKVLWCENNGIEPSVAEPTYYQKR